MDNNSIIASSLHDNELAQAFSELVAERWDNWDLSEFLPFLVDTCAASALPYLADQFDVEGLRGFGMAMNEQQQRDIIKKSIALHKYIGTPWAIREACRTVGFPVVVLEEGVTAVNGGPHSPDDWARFRVIVEADIARHITSDEARKMRVFVEYYKNERSHLVELGFFQSFVDSSVFHPGILDREAMEIRTMSISPNPVVINPAGNARSITIKADVEWTIVGNVFEWGDGSGDTFMVQHTGAMGQSILVVRSDANDVADRVTEIELITNDGRVLGCLKVQQKFDWNNAYSRAYSKAFNAFEYSRHLEVSPDVVSISHSDGGGESTITSNVSWDIQ